MENELKTIKRSSYTVAVHESIVKVPLLSAAPLIPEWSPQQMDLHVCFGTDLTPHALPDVTVPAYPGLGPAAAVCHPVKPCLGDN